MKLGTDVFERSGYDWYRASSIPKALDNAIDVALALYLDILNLFSFLVSIFGGSKD